MSWINRVQLFIKLAPVVAVDKKSQSAYQRIKATRKAPRRSCQTHQVVAQLGVISFHPVGIGLAFGSFISTPVIPQTVISIKGITVILLGLGRLVYHALNGWLSALPDHFPTQITACLPIYEREDVDPVYFVAQVNNSSISAVFTSLGTGASGKLAALACSHNETVRWCVPKWRAIRRKFMPSTYICTACLRISSG
jgi:hypothetical protein